METGTSRGAITVFGGTGFLGRRIARHLLDRGFRVRVASRHPERAQKLFGAERLSVEAVGADVGQDEQIEAALSGMTGAVNAVSLYVEHGEQTFHSVHVEAAARVARLCHARNLEQLIHISGVGADPQSCSPYIRARGEGEAAVCQAFSDVVLIRPAVMFGLDDAFLTTIVKLLKRLPVYPMFGKGGTRLQPVHVEDVGEAIARLAENTSAAGRAYEFGGPRVYTYENLLRSIASRLGVQSRLMPMPFPIWTALATASEWIPVTGLTRNQVELMRQDNVVTGNLPGLSDLDVSSTPIEVIAAQMNGKGQDADKNGTHAATGS
jgi:uncharacterized protein YbjT (DUF2867 family)